MNLVAASSILLGCLLCPSVSRAFQGPRFSNPHPSDRQERIGGRRDFLGQIALIGGAVLVASPSLPAKAEEDPPSTLYNPDGSLKEGIQVDTKFRTVEFAWDPSDELSLNVDGINSGGVNSGTKFKLSYELPEKWSTGIDSNGLYFDKAEGVNGRAVDHITVYQAPGTVPLEELEKATKVGVAKALKVPDDMKGLVLADLVGGRTSTQNGQKYFEFDLAVAPATCGSSQDNLGLGFCPYDSVTIMGATSLEDKLYVIVLQCDKSEWKRSGSDLRRVRSSFRVERA